MPADSTKAVPLPCSFCTTIPPTHLDVFCRNCGNRLSLQCAGCNHSMRVGDTFCPNCGHRRYAIFDVFRYGLRTRTPAAILLTTFIAGASWLLLRYALRNKL